MATKKTIKLFLSILLSFVLITGCGKSGDESGNKSAGGGSSPASTKTIGLSVQTLTNPFFKVITDKVQAEAAKHGYTVLARDAEASIANQKNHVDEFIVKKVDAIILCPRNTTAIGPIIKEANSKGIPVFTVDTICEDKTAKVVYHVGTDNVQGGTVAGQAMIDALGEAGGKIAVLELKEVESCRDRVTGFKQKIDEHNKSAGNKIEIVTSLECAGAKPEGQAAARDALNSHPDLRGIFAINDPAALGANAALEAEGKADKVVVVGFDGMPEAKQAIRDGKLFDSPVQFPEKMSEAVVEAVAKYFDGRKLDPVVLIPTASYRQEDAKRDPSLSK